ncbi:MAG: hypothetical protein IK093_20335 [Ruminiclostridium sp.]|nr:hypothetical protein [Ruminiclostridium sp.]
MKFRKLISVLAIIAVASSGAAGMLTVNSAAYNTNGMDLDYYITDYFTTYSGQTSLTISNDLDSATFISGDALVTMNNWAKQGKSFRFIISDSITEYSIVLDNTFFTALNNSSGNDPVNKTGFYSTGFDPKLSFTTLSNNTIFKITNVAAAGFGTAELNYTFSGANTLGALIEAYGVKPSYAYYLKEHYNVIDPANGSSNEVVTRVFKPTSLNADKTIPFSSSVNEWYYTVMRQDEMDYYKEDYIEPIVDEKLQEVLGFTEEELSKTNVKTYIDNVKKDLMSELYDEDSKARYATAEDVAAEIKKYYAPTETSHLSDLANALISTQKDTIDNEIYRVFGLGTSGGAVSVVNEAVTKQIVDAIIKELIGTGTPVESYKTAIQYYLDQKAYETIQEFKEQLELITNNLTKPDGSHYTSLFDVLSVLNTFKNDIQESGVTLKDIIDSIAATSNLNTTINKALEGYVQKNDLTGFITADELNKYVTTDDLSNYATTDDLNKYATTNDLNKYATTNDLNKYATTDQLNNYVTTNDLNKYVETSALNNYITYQDLYNQRFAYESEITDLKQQIAALNSSLEDLKDEVDKIKYYDSYYYNGYNSLSDWALSRYGSIDNFVALVANEVVKKLGTYGSYGESAYDVAVRNGFRGTEREWLNSLVGDSAYEVAVRNGFTGSESAWLASLKGEKGTDGADGRDGKDGKDGRDGRDGTEGRVIYVYGEQGNSAAPTVDNNGSNSYGKVNNSDNTAKLVEDNKTAAVNVSPTNKTANPATGVAAGIIIPAAAAGSLLLLRKDKRKRGRRK